MSVESDKTNDTSMPFGDLSPHNMTPPSFTQRVSGPTSYEECKPVSKSYTHGQVDNAGYGTLVGPV